MLRFVIFDAVLFILPFAAYAGWLMVTRGSLSNVEDWQARTIAYLAIAGASSLLIALVIFTSYRAIPPGGTYTPAHMEDGHIVPGHIDPDPANPG